LGEITLAHPTAHAKYALHEMTKGSFRLFFWAGLCFAAVGLFAPWLETIAVPFVLIGLLAHEHAYVQAGQAVPLA
ncbi:MAG: hypothetical protein NZ578_08390, partial [Candidatus Binatia bacterium]|nr:hypothetical protein [Candidatus Binatia bacterium]